MNHGTQQDEKWTNEVDAESFEVKRHHRPRSPFAMMRETWQSIARFCRDESGPTSVEYLFMLSLVIFACVAGIGLVGNATLSLFLRSKNKL